MCLEDVVDKFIFKQTRIGFDGKPFTIYKILTIEPGLENQRPTLKSRHDSCVRKGKMYRFLRAFGVDEFPQIYNILKGEMALVGPRPLTPEEDFKLPEDFSRERKKHKPGIIPPYYADLEAALKDEINPEDRIRTDWTYLKEKEIHPILTDIKCIGNTLYNFIVKGVRSF